MQKANQIGLLFIAVRYVLRMYNEIMPEIDCTVFYKGYCNIR